MKNVLTVKNMRDSDSATIKSGIPGRELMKRAGEAIFGAVEKQSGWKSPVAIVCGTGNNGGDGYVLALLLKAAGISCSLFLLEEKFSEDGRYYFDKCLEEKIPVVFISEMKLKKPNGIEKDESDNSNILIGEITNDDPTCDEIVKCNIRNQEFANVTGDKKENGKCNKKGYNVSFFSDFETIVDCIYGTGFHGDVTGKCADVIKNINLAGENGTFVVSVDINSGLNGSNGMSILCVVSDLTVSVGDYQPGHFLNMAKDVMKNKENCPIGIDPIYLPYRLFEEKDAKTCFPQRKNLSNKGTYGYIALIGGSARYSGAIRLANLSNEATLSSTDEFGSAHYSEPEITHIANSSMRSGAGVVSVAVPKSLCKVVASHVLESTLYPLSDREGELVFDETEFSELIINKKAIAFGMGIGKSEETKKALEYLLNNYKGILVIDADGLNCLAEMPSERIRNSVPNLVLTPHIKEFSRLTGKDIASVLESPCECAAEYARQTGAILLLKGPCTIVTDGEEVILVDTGCPGMATAGSGDVLSGIMAAVCGANTENPLFAAATAAWVNGRAGELAQDKYGAVSMIASDTVEMIPQVIKNLEKC